MNSDELAAKKSKELLPCEWECHITGIKGDHNPICPANFRPAVAAELRKAYAEIDDIKQVQFPKRIENITKEYKAEIFRLQTKEQAYEFIQRTYEEREKALGEAYAEIHGLRAELQHWREAAASVGQADGHGWAEETKSLRAELAARDKAKESDSKS